jgi:hypothetical protein
MLLLLQLQVKSAIARIGDEGHKVSPGGRCASN